MEKMTRIQTMEVLRLLSSGWPNLAPTETTLDGWHFAFVDEDPIKIISAARYVLKTRTKDSPPKPSDLIVVVEQFKEKATTSGEIAWSNGPRGAQSDFEKNVWTLWGGAGRFSMLPDTSYPSDSGNNERIVSFARKEFIDLFNAQLEKKKNDPYHLTHKDSARVLKLIDARKSNAKRIAK